MDIPRVYDLCSSARLLDCGDSASVTISVSLVIASVVIAEQCQSQTHTISAGSSPLSSESCRFQLTNHVTEAFWKDLLLCPWSSFQTLALSVMAVHWPLIPYVLATRFCFLLLLRLVTLLCLTPSSNSTSSQPWISQLICL